MVVNVAADYWKAGQVGFLAGCKALGLSSSKCTYFAPPNGKLTEQDSELETLRSQGITGYSISAIDPASAKGTIATDMGKGVFVLPIDSPLPGTAAAGLYLGTPNTEAPFLFGRAKAMSRAETMVLLHIPGTDFDSVRLHMLIRRSIDAVLPLAL